MEKKMEKLRGLLSAKASRLFSAPYLPPGLIWSAFLLAYTDLIVILLGQPAGYWIDRSQASSSFSLLENLISTGLLPYIFVGLLYLGILWFLLTVLTRTLALAAWMPLAFIHVNHILSWVAQKIEGTSEPSWDQAELAAMNGISALMLGIILVNGLLVHKRQAEDRPNFRHWIKPAAFGVWIVSLMAAVAIAAILPRGGWMPLQPEHTPGRRAISAVAYDPVRKKAVLFGGISEWIGSSFFYERDTWEWDGNDWIEMKPETVPPARAGHMMTYDPEEGVVLMFGGEDKSGAYMLADTWIWDGKDWEQLYPANYPPGRRGGQLFYDDQTGKIILTGGFYYGPEKVFTALNDSWAWNGEDWEYLASTEHQLMITNPNVAYDPLQKRATLFNYKEILSWTGEQWSEIEVTRYPPARLGTWLAANPESGSMLIFGGIEKNVRFNDTWMFEKGTWKELHPDLTPAPRDAHVMFFDPSRNSFIVYGGINTYALDDMWEYVLP